MSFEKMTPFELGETKEKGAIPYLIIYLKNGNDNEKRLAASAIAKLIPYHKNVCRKTIPFLIENLHNTKPQVRHYSLKTLREFELTEDYYPQIKAIAQHDEKYYNQNIASELLKTFRQYQPEDETPSHSSDGEESTSTGKGYVYFIQEDFSGRVKIGKTENLEQRMQTFGVKLPFNIQLIHSIISQNHHYTEKLFHVYFEDKQVNGEWFELTQEDIEWIQSDNYTKRISDSIVTPPRNSPASRNITVKATDNQKKFLSTLLADRQKALLCSIDNISVEEASDLIAYLYKEIEPLSDIKELVIDSPHRSIM